MGNGARIRTMRNTPRAVVSAAGLVLAGLFASFLRDTEVYTGLDHGVWLLTLIGVAGLCGQMEIQLPPSSDWPVAACLFPYRIPLPARFASGVDLPAAATGWPLLIALLFGPLCVLLAGLGGWV